MSVKYNAAGLDEVEGLEISLATRRIAPILYIALLKGLTVFSSSSTY